jgi:ABC-2 type transport system permease protein
MMQSINIILTLAYRDVVKFLRDKARIIATFVFPFIFVGILGSSLNDNVGGQAGIDFLLFTFTGVLAQTLFQSTASGIISLIEDRENDFSQEIFVSPISRYLIIVGKIIGESLVAFMQLFGIIGFGLLLGVRFNLVDLIKILPIGIAICFFGGAFGVLVLSNLKSQRAANQVFPFLVLPQFFLAGIFNPINTLSNPILLVLSRIAPMTYAVDLLRSLYYQGHPDLAKVTLNPPWVNLLVIVVASLIFITAGTWMFVRNERNR